MIFLNKTNFVHALFQLFHDAEDELILIVPYIRMSNEVYEALKDCDARGVEILIVCRMDCLHDRELNKLKQLKHITLLAHPNLHSKIYLNSTHIIIGSMNLYEYSEKFNREAGVKFNQDYEHKYRGNIFESRNLEVEDCKNEIIDVISGTEEIIVSERVADEGINFGILKTKDEKKVEKAKKLTKIFTTKTFKISDSEEGSHPTCKNFYDQIDVVISNRVAIFPKYPEHILEHIFEKYNDISEDHFENLRTYTSRHHKRFTIYPESGYNLSDLVYDDKEFTKYLEQTTMAFCKELDKEYKLLMRN